MQVASSSSTRPMKSRFRRTSIAEKVSNGLFVTPSTTVSVTPNKTAAMMLNHLGLNSEAEKIEAAALEAVRQKKTTQDLGGSLRTKEAGDWVAERISKL